MTIKRPLTIVQCVNSLDLGGLERMVLSLAQQLKIRGYGSTICCIENRGTLADEAEQLGIPVYAIEMARHGKWRGFQNMRHHLTTNPQPVILHSHNFKPVYYSSLATMFGASRGHIHTRHGALLQQHRAMWRYRFLRHWVDAWVTVSADRQAELAERTGLPPSAIHVLANGVDTVKFCPTTDKPAIRRQLKLPEHAPAIMVAARLAPEKDLGTLLRAFAQVHRAVPSAELWFIGDGPERPGLQSLGHDLGISSQVRFIGQRNDVDQFLKAADVFVLSSLSEGLSVALIEAAASGLPIVATDVGGNCEVVKAPESGRLVPVGNPPALAASLIEILQSEPLRVQMGQASRAIALEKFGIAQMTDRYVALYEDAIRRRQCR